MSVAAPIDVIDVSDVSRPHVLERGVVAVHNYGFGHSMAACSCGWTCRRRYLKAAAEQDAWVHSMHEKCAVSVPLVIPVFSLRTPA
jgi:hypothetical protein